MVRSGSVGLCPGAGLVPAPKDLINVVHSGKSNTDDTHSCHPTATTGRTTPLNDSAPQNSSENRALCAAEWPNGMF